MNRLKKYWEALDNWCNRHLGILALFGTVIVIFIPIIQGLKIKRSLFPQTLVFIKNLLLYQVSTPIYSLIIFFIILFIFYIKIKRRYARNAINHKLFTGRWRNDWILGDGAGHETFFIGNDDKYIIDNVEHPHRFNIEDFKLDEKRRSITFYKKGVLPGDERKLYNNLKIINNDRLEGTETNNLPDETGRVEYKITYTRLSNK